MLMPKEMVGENPQEGDMLSFKILKVLPEGCEVEPVDEAQEDADEPMTPEKMKDMSPEQMRKKMPVADRSDMSY